MSWQIKAQDAEQLLKEIASSLEDGYTEEIIISRKADGSFQVTGDKRTFWENAILPEEANALRSENAKFIKALREIKRYADSDNYFAGKKITAILAIVNAIL